MTGTQFHGAVGAMTIHTAGLPSFWKMAVDGSEMLGAPPTRASVTLTVMPSRNDAGGFTIVVRTW